MYSDPYAQWSHNRAQISGLWVRLCLSFFASQDAVSAVERMAAAGVKNFYAAAAEVTGSLAALSASFPVGIDFFQALPKVGGRQDVLRPSPAIQDPQAVSVTSAIETDVAAESVLPSPRCAAPSSLRLSSSLRHKVDAFFRGTDKQAEVVPFVTRDGCPIEGRDGNPDNLIIRRLWLGNPADMNAVRDVFFGMSLDDRRSRFSGTCSDDAVARYLAQTRGTVFLGVCLRSDPHTLIAVSEIKLSQSPSQRPGERPLATLQLPSDCRVQKRAELAFVVRTKRKGQGIGSQLMRASIAECRRLKVSFIDVVTTSSNRWMYQLASRSGFVVDVFGGDVFALMRLAPSRGRRAFSLKSSLPALGA